MSLSTAMNAIFSRMRIAESGCWEVTGCADKDGYPKIGKKARAHRIAYAFFNGDPIGRCVCHSCDNRKCVNPEHLWLGTNQQNTADRNAKRRQACRDRIRKSLSIEAARAAKLDANSGMLHRDVARKYGVSPAQVSLLARSMTWHFKVDA